MMQTQRVRSAPTDWPLQDAKARFSEVVERAIVEGPQRVTRHGKDAVVVVAASAFDGMSKRLKQPESLIAFFQQSPLAGIDLDLTRDQNISRDIDL